MYTFFLIFWFLFQAKSLLGKSKGVKSNKTRYQDPFSRMNQRRKSLSTSNLFSKTQAEHFRTLNTQHSEPAYQHTSYQEGFYLHSSNQKINFAESDSQCSLQSLPKSPYRDRNMQQMVTKNKTRVEQSLNLVICETNSEVGSFSLSELDPVQEKEENIENWVEYNEEKTTIEYFRYTLNIITFLWVCPSGVHGLCY